MVVYRDADINGQLRMVEHGCDLLSATLSVLLMLLSAVI